MQLNHPEISSYGMKLSKTNWMLTNDQLERFRN